GTGNRIPLSITEAAAEVGSVWLAGGLNPDNVAEVIDKIKPELIDVSSGVEASPGKKDHEKMKLFFSRVPGV
ncbi:MAG: bifunctional indole-3-glycerol phosphate synthase/phosphoribosylanthranilate isomerase, partial [Spirochaetales bacterium]|nr:bifunctional indole-3-glycerol phosphate synthase/phosphoribosylanthranilate isomerase [Spirochaetales bacterium]